MPTRPPWIPATQLAVAQLFGHLLGILLGALAIPLLGFVICTILYLALEVLGTFLGGAIAPDARPISPQPREVARPAPMDSRTAALGATVGLITADLATGMQQFTEFSRDAAGNMVVCPDSAGTCKHSGGWEPLGAQVPTGRTYVGFRVVGPDGGRLELYWK